MTGERLGPNGSTNAHGDAAPSSARLDLAHDAEARESFPPSFPFERAEQAVEGLSRFAGPAALMLALGSLAWWAFF